MKPADRTKTLPDVANAGNTPQFPETGALRRVAGDDYNLICDTGE
jgi:hypothetical protein